MIPALRDGASEVVESNPFAFALAAVLDRGTKSEIIWTLPCYLENKIGKLEPRQFVEMSLDEKATLIHSLPHRPRYINDAPRTVKELSQIVVQEFDSDASKIWSNRTQEQVKATFRRVYGVGPGISSMIVLLLERCLSVQFAGTDHRMMDVKPDVHVRRVFRRLGFTHGDSEEEALEAARRLNPDFPGALDPPTWLVGKQWCREVYPLCETCPLGNLCPSSKGS